MLSADAVGEGAGSSYVWILEGGEEGFDPAWPDLCVGVEEDEVLALGFEDSDIAAFGEAVVLLICDEFDGWWIRR